MYLIDMIEDLTFHQRSVERSEQYALTVGCESGFGKEGTRFAQLSTVVALGQFATIVDRIWCACRVPWSLSRARR